MSEQQPNDPPRVTHTIWHHGPRGELAFPVQLLGRWDLPSGNEVVVSLGPEDEGMRSLCCQWARHPLPKEDIWHFKRVIAGEIMARLGEYLEIPADDIVYAALPVHDAELCPNCGTSSVTQALAARLAHERPPCPACGFTEAM